MRQVRRSMRAVATLLLVTFVGVGVWLGYTVYVQGSRWTTDVNNPRMNTYKNKFVMGDITDRQDVVLASTDSDGVRHYNSDKTLRRAMSQTVGDQMSMSGTGVETFHAGSLLGYSGSIIDRTWQFITGAESRGDNIRLTVDSELTKYISSKFADGYKGAVVVLNYKTGEILSMVSKPDYDPENLTNRRSSTEETDSAYLNRCLQGQYTPGSIFKVVTLAAALDSIPNVTSHTFSCEGTHNFGNGKVTCHSGQTSHGQIDLLTAFVKSCNITFGGLAYEMGDKALVKTAKSMAFNDNFSFKDIVLYESSIPESISGADELAWTGAGQGLLQVTPMHMAMIAASVANDGVMLEPQLIGQVTGVGNIPRIRTAAGAYGRVMSSETAHYINNSMEQVVKSGTAKNAAIKGYTVCGKTGSAETSDDKSVPTDAWFIGYVRDDDHPYAISVVIERGGAGSDKASTLAARALEKAISLNL